MNFQTERQMLQSTTLRDGDFKSIRDILERLLIYKPDAKVLGGLDEQKQIFTYTSREMYEEIMNLGDGLIDAGMKDGHIAIVAENSCRYVIADTCISNGVGVVSPIDVDAPAEVLSTLLCKCDANAAFCSAKVLEKVREAQKSCPLLKVLFTIDKKVEGFTSYDELVEAGKRLKDKSIYRKLELDVDAPAKILFTSGTTGANKGVVLTNANLTQNALNCIDSVMATPGEENVAMSILPMHHATEINTHIMCRIAGGRLTYINDSIRNMMTNIKIFKPLTITIVPMIANAFYKTIWATAEKEGKAGKLRKGIRISNMLRKFGVDKTHEMFADLYAPFGGNLRMIVCGGAMLNPTVVKGMNDLGIRLENGYGITECGPLISINSNPLKEYRSVGKPCPSLEARIANPDENGIGDLCIKGKSVFKEYYKDPESTAAVFDKDGFFNTGDSAYIDKKGHIFLVGRKKNTIILESGKNICPEEVENIIEINLPYASDIVVYQAEMNGRKFLCAGLYIQDEARRSDRAGIEDDMRKANRSLPEYKRINYIELPSQEYPKTSSRKIIRKNLPSECSGDGIKLI